VRGRHHRRRPQAWLGLLCLDGPLATAEPKTLRYRLLHTAARIVRPAQTQVPHSANLALGTATGSLLGCRARHTPTDLTPHQQAPAPDPDPTDQPGPWNPAPTRGDSRNSSLTVT
jgi:hypothetical protein